VRLGSARVLTPRRLSVSCALSVCPLAARSSCPPPPPPTHTHTPRLIPAAINIYLDVVNLFLYILRLVQQIQSDQ
jgi:hypothetical protein